MKQTGAKTEGEKKKRRNDLQAPESAEKGRMTKGERIENQLCSCLIHTAPGEKEKVKKRLDKNVGA